MQEQTSGLLGHMYALISGFCHDLASSFFAVFSFFLFMLVHLTSLFL